MRRALVTALAILCFGPVLAPAGAVPRPLLPALHARRGAGAGIFDAFGRQVLLRGVNVNQLGDYYQDDPRLAPVVPLTEDDFAQMAALGFNVVRLIVSWSYLEPRRGFVDPAYVARIHQAVGWAAAHGLYVVLDMHQDAWGKYIATPPHVSCPSPLVRAIGWDGAPQWATITDGLSTCRLALREASLAVADAWQNFYLDRDGIQSELIRSWAALAGSFAADPTVAGYDLLNEPNPGLVAAGPSDLALLGLFYERALAAIRAAESRAGGRGRKSFHHIGFIEPMATWSALSVGVSPGLTFPLDTDVVYSPHLYGGSISALPLPVSFGFGEAQREAAVYGVAWWTGEWGWFGDAAADGASVATFGSLEDQYLAGGAWWQWKQACGDPHTIGSPGAGPAAVADGLNRYACPSGLPLGQPAAFVRVLDRAFPRAVPGRLVAFRSSPLIVRGETDRPGAVDLWIPGSARPVVNRPAVLTRVAGGWLASVGVAAGRYSVSARV